MLHWCYSIIHPSYHAVTLKGHHPHGTHIDVWACDISQLLSLHPSDPSTHFCLILSLPSRLFLSGRPRCDSMFPKSEWIGTPGEKKWVREQDRAATVVLASVCSQLVCGGAGGEKSTVYQMSLLNIAQAEWALTRTVRHSHQDNSSSQKDLL